MSMKFTSILLLLTALAGQVATSVAVLNDDCANAELIVPNFPVTGDTDLAQSDPEALDFCGTSHTDANGVWYKIIGTGNNFMADTCGSDYDTKIHVYTGSCGSFSCTGGNDDACGVQTRVWFNTVVGETYYILVHGFSRNSGVYQMTVFDNGPPPSNDQCPGAIPLTLDTAVSGSTIPAQPDGGLDFCGTSFDDMPGVWHSVQGNGNVFQAQTCGSDYDTKVHVYTGPDCDNLSCVGGNEDSGLSDCGQQSQVNFATLQGETYWILVHGYQRDGVGSYQLNVTDVGAPPPNDECPGAIALSLDTIVSGDTRPAQSDGDFDFCGTTYNGAPGTWYSVVGNGGNYEASTCGSTYDTKVHVYTGADCNNLSCVGGNDNACGAQSKVRFTTVANEVYYILVHGRNSNSGEYQLTVTEYIPPSNDECPGALDLALDSTLLDNTAQALPDDEDYEFCGTSHQGAKGLWYQIQGSGNTTLVDTCGSGFNTKLHVFGGPDCNTLTCIGGNDNSCGTRSRVRFATAVGETYYVLVHGRNSASGSFQLTATDLGLPPANDECTAAIDVSLDIPVVGNTAQAAPDGDFDFCGTSHNGAPGTWYRIIGNGNNFEADTCGSSFNTKLHVYSGSDCGSLSCIGGNDNSCGTQSRVIFATNVGEDYWILVHGRNSAAGEFQLTVTDLGPPPPNDDCPGAVSINLNTPVFGRTDIAQPDDGPLTPACGAPNFGAPGVWFSIIGNGATYEASTCGSDYNTILHVYSGSDCNSLSCVGGNDNSCGIQSRVIFATVPGEEYRILVHGVFTDSGNYQLTVNEFVPPANDQCPSAAPIALNTQEFGNTNPATPDPAAFEFCGTSYNDAPGVWYTTVGNGNEFTVDTCGSEYDTKLHVYRGADCDNLSCVGGNDDAGGSRGSTCGGLNSRVVFDTIPGETYWILVHGFGSDRGVYRLNLSGATRVEGGGDPHITTWKQEHYEYHGQCDLVMLNDGGFADGLGLDVHIRTKLVRHWSYIKSVVIRIGNDILEIKGSVDANDDQAHYWMNYEYQGELESIGGFPVIQKLPSVYKRSYTIDFGSKYPGQSIIVQLYREFVRVRINGQETAFGNSVGLMGNYKTGKTLARDGVTVLDDFTEFGDEWQVLPSDPKLFREASPPQFPELCIKPEDPRGERQRRLAESEITLEQAESACTNLKDPLVIKDCVYDILATQDLDMAGAF